MAEIKAIETEYNGYKFRSRLEARWAVFFDALGIQYQYEIEGYETKSSDGTVYKYLPDFYLPDLNVFVEVKATDEALFKDSDKIGAMIDFNSTPIANGLLILGNIPNPDMMEWGNIPAFSLLSWHKGVFHELATFFPTAYNKISLLRGGAEIMKTLFMFDDMGYGETEAIPETASTECRWTMDQLRSYGERQKFFSDLKEAYRTARQARFEYGETPKARR